MNIECQLTHGSVKRCGIRRLEISDLYLSIEWRTCENRLCSLRVDVGVGFRLIACHENVIDVVESNLIDLDGFAGVRFVGFDFDVGELRVGFEIEVDSTVFVV